MKTRGFSLLEVLITLVLLSVGLLGVAALQLNSLRYTATSAGRNQAALFAQEVVERIRENPGVDYSSASGTAINCYVTTCSTDQLRTFDLIELKARLQDVNRGGLQNGQLTITPASSGYVVRIDWDEVAAYNKAASAAAATATSATMSLYTREQ